MFRLQLQHIHRMDISSPVINPEDATDNPNGFDGPDWDNTTGTGNWSPSPSNFMQLFALSKQSNPFVQQFELNAAAIGDGASAYVGPLAVLCYLLSTQLLP